VALNRFKIYRTIETQEEMVLQRVRLLEQSDFDLVFKVMSGGIPVDLTDTTVALTYSDSNVVSETITGSITDASNGEMKFEMTPLNTATDGEYEFDVAISDGSATARPIQGLLTLLKVD